MSKATPDTLFDLDLPVSHIAWARRWLLLGVAALAVSGILAVLLVLSRTVAKELLPWGDFFYTALVVHVDLSILIWFLAVGGALWCLNNRRPEPGWFPLSAAAFYSFAAGTLIIAGCPFFGIGPAVMSNYIPVLDHPLFLSGLGLVLAGVGLQLFHTFGWGRWRGNALAGGIQDAALLTCAAIAACIAAYAEMAPGVRGHALFETLFWGGGHVLQYAYTVLMLVAWLVLAQDGLRVPVILYRMATLSFLLLAVAMAVMLEGMGGLGEAYFVTPTQHMRWFGGTIPLLVAVPLAFSMLRSGLPRRAYLSEWLFLLTSMLLFGVGGVLGYAIGQTPDLTTPAHYHGAIVGVTLAFMGLTVHLLPRLGYEAVHHTKLAVATPLLYAAGQLLHIAGLAWQGSYGIARKTPGAAEAAGVPHLAVEFVRLGGLLAIIGGFCFVWMVLRAVTVRRKA